MEFAAKIGLCKFHVLLFMYNISVYDLSVFSI
jgi:hypothetical protein